MLRAQLEFPISVLIGFFMVRHDPKSLTNSFEYYFRIRKYNLLYGIMTMTFFNDNKFLTKVLDLIPNPSYLRLM